jgi:putative DNA primase/helicase
VACYIDESDREPEGLLKDIYADYRAYCADSGMKPLGKQNFRKRLESHGYEVEKINAGMRVFRKE